MKFRTTKLDKIPSNFHSSLMEIKESFSSHQAESLSPENNTDILKLSLVRKTMDNRQIRKYLKSKQLFNIEQSLSFCDSGKQNKFN
jgi:hypothetical protein